eukprot:3216872-Pyramimonas_sp.AAC.2
MRSHRWELRKSAGAPFRQKGYRWQGSHFLVDDSHSSPPALSPNSPFSARQPCRRSSPQQLSSSHLPLPPANPSRQKTSLAHLSAWVDLGIFLAIRTRWASTTNTPCRIHPALSMFAPPSPSCSFPVHRTRACLHCPCKSPGRQRAETVSLVVGEPLTEAPMPTINQVVSGAGRWRWKARRRTIKIMTRGEEGMTISEMQNF